MHMYIDLMSDMVLLTCSFMVVKSDVCVLTPPVQYIIFPPSVIIVQWFSVFFVLMAHTALTYISFLSFGLSFWKMNSIVSVPACFSIFATGVQVHFTLRWYIVVYPSWLGLCIPNCSLYFHSGCGLLLFPLWLFLFWGLCNQISMCLCVFLFFRFFHWKHFRRFLKLVTWLDLLVLDLVLYLFVMVISTLMSLFGVFSTSGITLGCASGVSTFIFPTFIIDHFPFSWRNYRIFSWLEFPLFFLRVCLLEFLWVLLHHRHPRRLCIGEWSLWLGWIFNLVFFLVNLFGFSWYVTLAGTLGGTTGGAYFPNISARIINDSVCGFPSVNIGLKSLCIMYCMN